MKIIKVDNFNRDYVSDKLICENVNDYWGKHIVKFLNDRFSGERSSDYFRLVEDNHKLFVGDMGE